MWRPNIWALLGGMAMSDGLLGCDLGCDKESSRKDATRYPLRSEQAGGTNDPDEAPGGRVNLERTIYETNGWNEPFVEFPAGRKLEIEHGLGTEPEVFTWLAFDRFPFEEKRSAAESAGNMVLILKNKDGVIVVRNDTCQDFYLRLVAISPGEFGDGSGQGGAGGADGAGGSE